MTEVTRDLHVYLRSIAQGERTSLSVLAGMVRPASRVLDLGTGSGALGEHLRDKAGCTVDGVTINEREAAIARPHYRRVEVANLEQSGWNSAFQDCQYDFIVCADVLEHLSQPQTALQACRELLAPGGRVLISVPNAAYSGLVAELLQGDFTYRDEGLLDRTHLRFFTRRSLLQSSAVVGSASLLGQLGVPPGFASSPGRRVAVLGGGMAGLTTAYQLSRTPELRARYDVTVASLGFRLG